MVETRKLDILIAVLAIAMVIYHMIFPQYLNLFLQPTQHNNFHLAFALVLVFMFRLQGSTKKYWRLLFSVAAILSLVATGYVAVFHEELADRVWYNTPLDLVIGAILILLVLEATRQAFGLLVPILALIIVIYPFIGHHLPEPFYATSLSLAKTISNLSVGLTGIYGTVLSISAVYIFLFVVFGALLQVSGATGFFIEIGKMIGNKLRSGPALAAVTSSALVGMVTGSVAANIVITGSFTIPLMKKAGYTPEQAGAIEAAASNGGQIMPPVMGVIAFAMAGMTGIPYVKIIAMAAIPAILYFLCGAVYVQLRAEQMKIAFVRTSAPVDVRELLLLSFPFFISIAVIIILLISGLSVMYVAFWAIISIIAVSLVRKKTRPSLGALVRGLTEGAKTGAEIGVILACMGLVVSTFTMGGLGVKLSAGIETWSGGYLFPAAVIIAATSILMGMGGVAVAAYIIISVFGVPVLMRMGIGLEQAHFFVMFTTVFSYLTPPIAIGALIASQLAGGNYMKTAIESCKVASAGFLLPFMFIYVPALLLLPQEPLQAVTGIIACIAILLACQIFFVGYCLTACSRIERALWLVTTAVLFVYLLLQAHALFAMGMALFILLTLWQWRRRKSVEPTQRIEAVGK